MTLRLLVPVLALAVLPASASAQPPLREAPIEIVIDLAETLGEAHAIRSLCEVDANGVGDQTWRTYMFSMLSMEGPTGSPRRAALTSAFNRGFRSQQGRGNSCTPDMKQMEAQIAARGRMLAESVAASYLQ